MKTILAVIALFLCSAIPAMADVSKEDVKKLLNAGVGDGVILEFIKSKAPVRMTASDLVDLKKLGASDKVLAALAHEIKDKKVAVQETITIFATQPSHSTVHYGGWPYWYFGFGTRYRYSWHCPPVHHQPPCQPRPQPHCPPQHGPGHGRK